jgi:rhodanese-related sulfurtransferase
VDTRAPGGEPLPGARATGAGFQVVSLNISIDTLSVLLQKSGIIIPDPEYIQSAGAGGRTHLSFESEGKVKQMEHSEGFLKLAEEARRRIREISVEETMERLNSGEGARLIDVREDHEWEAGHAASAEHLSKGIIERDIEKAVPEKGTELILYCGGGYRSAIAAEAIQRMGYYDVSSMAGGWRAWQEAGAPVESE